MASVYYLLGYRAPVPTPIMRSAVRASEIIASSSTAAAGTLVAQENEVCEIYSPVDIWVAFGETPVAAPGNMFFVPGGSPRNFYLERGDKISVLEA